MKIDQRKYYLKFKETLKLLEELNKPVFLKTELDVVYDDFVRWENNKLLWQSSDIEKNSQRRYSYVEYTWVKLIEQLRAYGFEYEMIKSFFPMLFHRIDAEIIYRGLLERAEELISLFDRETIDNFINNKDELDVSDLNVTLFEMLLINAVSYNDSVSLLFFSDTYGFCFPISGEVYKELEKNPENERLRKYLEGTYLSISISGIIKKFVEPNLESKGKEAKFKSILSKEEHDLLKLVRKKNKEIKSLKIRFNSGKMSLIEIKTTKKVEMESRLMEHINKGDYSSILIESVDGRIVNFENTRKYKL